MDYVSKHTWANTYKEQILDLYHIVQKNMDDDIEWNTETLLGFIDLIFENSTGELSNYV